DGDGKDEIFCAGITELDVLHGDGTPALLDLIGVTDAPVAFGNDGRVEIGTYGGFFVYYTRKYTVTLRDPLLQPYAEFPRRLRGGFFPHPALADLDGDRKLDIALLQENRKLAFKAKAVGATGRPLALTRFRVPRSKLLSSAGILSFADVDHDGKA